MRQLSTSALRQLRLSTSVTRVTHARTGALLALLRPSPPSDPLTPTFTRFRAHTCSIDDGSAEAGGVRKGYAATIRGLLRGRGGLHMANVPEASRGRGE